MEVRSVPESKRIFRSPGSRADLRTSSIVTGACSRLDAIAVPDHAKRPSMATPVGRTVVQVILGGALLFAIGVWLGRLGAGA